MDTPQLEWKISCDWAAFAKCRSDERFAYVVALARSTNALNAVHSLMILAGDGSTPRASRDRMNAYLFASALLYEILKLIRRMNRTFHNDETFQKELRCLLKDPIAKKIEEAHLGPVRRKAVFHFDPDGFAEAILKSTVSECVFVETAGNLQGDVSYSFADVIAAEILVGFAQDSKAFYVALEDAMAGTRSLVVRFVPATERFVVHHLIQWGFKMTPGKPKA